MTGKDANTFYKRVTKFSDKRSRRSSGRNNKRRDIRRSAEGN